MVLSLHLLASTSKSSSCSPVVIISATRPQIRAEKYSMKSLNVAEKSINTQLWIKAHLKGFPHNVVAVLIKICFPYNLIDRNMNVTTHCHVCHVGTVAPCNSLQVFRRISLLKQRLTWLFGDKGILSDDLTQKDDVVTGWKTHLSFSWGCGRATNGKTWS